MADADRCLEHDPPAVVMRVWEEYGYPATRPTCTCPPGADVPLFGMDLTPADELEAGRAARDAGIAAVEQATEEYDAGWRDAVDVAIVELAKHGQPFTVDDVRELLRAGEYGEPSRPNLWGGRFLAASRAGTIVRVGFRASVRKSRHANAAALWQGR